MSKTWKRAACFLLTAALLAPSALAKVDVDESQISDEAKGYAYWDTSLSDEERAADLISHMTVEEKLGQLVSHGSPAIPRLGVAEYWYPGENLNGIANITLWYGAAGDAKGGASAFPSTLAQGATWNSDLIGEMADAIGDEARAFYNTSKKGLSYWGPSVNLARDPRWGRTGDSFSEDGVISAELAGSFIQGFQGEYDDEEGLKAIATAKHFAANNAEETRSGGSSNMSESELREYYLRHFSHMVMDSGVQAIMPAYNAINGIPCHGSYDLLTNTLRMTWGFDGWVVSDNGGVGNLNSQYGANGGNSQKGDSQAFPVLDGGSEDFNGEENLNVTNAAEAAAAALNAGVNLDLGGRTMTSANLQAALDEGVLTMDTIDQALLDIFTSRFATGEFDNSDAYIDGYDSVSAFIEQNQDLAENVADEAIVLLENNDDFLPANIGDYDKIVVVGQYIEELLYSDYKSDNVWRDENGISVSFVKGIQDAVAEYNATNGTSIQVESIVLNETDGQVAAPTAEQMEMMAGDKVLTVYIPATRITMLTGGADAGEGNDRESLDLPRGQAEVGEQLVNNCSNLVVAMHTQSIVNVDWATKGEKKADAVLWASYLGEKQGAALANVLFGKVSPSGRLNTTWYADESQLCELQHDYSLYPTASDPKDIDLADGGSYGRTYMFFVGDVDYPFGYGLSYGEFAYSDYSITNNNDGTLTATVTVKNTSNVDASEVVQLYAVGPKAAELNRADKQLAGFDKVSLKAGESQQVTITVNVKDLAFWDESADCFDLDAGSWNFYLGSDCETKIADCEQAVALTADDLPKGLQAVTLTVDNYILEDSDQETEMPSTEVTTSVSLKNDTLYKDKAAATAAGITLSYASDNEDVATVDQNGKITAVGDGVCTITVTATKDGDTVTDSHAIVVKSIKGVTGITLDQTAATIRERETVTLKATITPADADYQQVIWTSSDPDVATVEDGVVKGVGVGTATITAKTFEGGKTATCEITVEENTDVDVTKITLTPTNVTNEDGVAVMAGGEITLKATVEPESATHPTVIWSTDDQNLSIAPDGNTCVVTVKAGATATSAVKVTATANDASSVTADAYIVPQVSAEMKAGETLDLVARLDADGTKNDNLKWDSTNTSVATVSEGKVTAISAGTVTIKAADVSGVLQASCQITVTSSGGSTGGGGGSTSTSQYTITVKQSDGGKIAPETVKVQKGKDQTFTITADAGYAIQDVLVDGKSVGAVSSYTFKNVTAGHTIQAVFAEQPFQFSDVDPNSWAAPYIYGLYEQGIVDGIGGNLFAPTRSITRAEFVKLLAGAAGVKDEDLSKDASTFTDVEHGSWYEPYVIWAVENKVATGTSATTFAPTALITRQEMATMLYRYAENSGIELPETVAASAFADADSISDWAADAVSAMQKAGVIDGIGGNLFAPTDNATREQACKVLMTFLEVTEK